MLDTCVVLHKHYFESSQKPCLVGVISASCKHGKLRLTFKLTKITKAVDNRSVRNARETEAGGAG